jgi:periplasmic divalent cation tolerance protein
MVEKKMQDFVIVLVTCASEEEAQYLAQNALENYLAACVNIFQCRSLFHWQNKIDGQEERLLILKTQRKLLDDLVALIKTHHSYELPEIIALPVIGGSAEYLDWIRQETE